MIYNQHSIHAQHRLRTRQLREAARRERLVPRRPQRRIRRLVGRSMVSIGARLAADPVNVPARPR